MCNVYYVCYMLYIIYYIIYSIVCKNWTQTEFTRENITSLKSSTPSLIPNRSGLEHSKKIWKSRSRTRRKHTTSCCSSLRTQPRQWRMKIWRSVVVACWHIQMTSPLSLRLSPLTKLNRSLPRVSILAAVAAIVVIVVIVVVGPEIKFDSWTSWPKKVWLDFPPSICMCSYASQRDVLNNRIIHDGRQVVKCNGLSFLSCVKGRV